MISNGSVFKLGFFSSVNSTNHYLGIWYNNISAFTVVWVANRQKPLNDSSGLLTISEDGNLVVLNGQKEILWSSVEDDLNGSSNNNEQNGSRNKGVNIKWQGRKEKRNALFHLKNSCRS